MNIPIDTHSTALNDLFFRAADRMRVEGCVNAVANEGLSLALSCVHEALLDHYVQQLLQRLRSGAPGHTLEVYFPANTESLISRFNEVLASQSLREATRHAGERQSAQIWLVHDAQTLPEHELQLLARLIQNFPGANIRAILLMTGQAPTQESLSAFGRKLLRWEIEPPTDEQALATLEVARLQGQGEAMTLLLRRMGKLRKLPAAWLDEGEGDETRGSALAPATSASSSSPSSGAPEALRRWLQALPAVSLASLLQTLRQGVVPLVAVSHKPGLSARLSGWPQRHPMLLAGAAALGLSVLLMMWLQPASFGLKGKARTAVQTAVAGQAEAAGSAPAANATQTTVVSATSARLTPPATDVPDAATEAQAWLRATPAQSFVIQHGSLPTYDKAQQMIKSYPSLRDARVVAAYRPGEKLAHFVVVSGPYEGAGKAYERLGRKDLPGTSWVRTVQSLQQQLDPTPKEAR